MMHVIDAVLGSFSNLFRSHRYSPVEKLYSVVVYDLGGLPGIYLKTLYANYVLTTLYRRATRAGMDDRLRTLVIAEAAQNYVRPRRLDKLPSMGERIVNELRG